MAVIELQPYDLYTSAPERIYSLQPLWANLSSLNARSVRLLVLTDHINYEAALHGFGKVAVPFEQLPRDLRWYRSYYEQYLRGTIRETQYIRLFLVISSSLDELTLRRVIEGYGIGTRGLDADGVPLPFSTATPHWDYAVDQDGNYWGMIQSEFEQSGAIVAQTLHKLFALEFPVYASLDIWNYSRSDAIRLLKTKAAVAKVQFGKKDSGHEQRVDANDTQAAVDHFRKEIGTLGVGLHEIRVNVATFGHSPQELDNRFELIRGSCPLDLKRRKAQVKLLETMFSAEPPAAAEREGTLTTSKHIAVLAGSALSYSRPTKMDGVLLGFDHAQSPVVVDMFDPNNKAYNAVVVGQTGSGKTFFTTLLMLRSLLTGVRLIIIDPKGDIDMSWLGQDNNGRELCRKIRVGTDESSLNILDKTFPDNNNQIEFVLGGLRLLGVYQPHERIKHSLLDKTLHKLYRKDQNPTLPQLRDAILQISHNQLGMVQEKANELAFVLEPFTHGSREKLFGRPTNIDLSLSAPVNIFDVSQFPSRQTAGNMRSMLFATLFGLVNQAIVNRRKRPNNPDLAPIQFFIDEIGVMMRDPVVADYTSDKYKTARSMRVAMIVADQTVASMLGMADEKGIRHGHEMFANSPYRFVFFQEGSEKKTLEQEFPMMPVAYRERIHKLPRGQCVAQTPQGIFNVMVTPSDLEKVVLGSQLTERQEAVKLINRMKMELRS